MAYTTIKIVQKIKKFFISSCFLIFVQEDKVEEASIKEVKEEKPNSLSAAIEEQRKEVEEKKQKEKKINEEQKKTEKDPSRLVVEYAPIGSKWLYWENGSSFKLWGIRSVTGYVPCTWRLQQYGYSSRLLPYCVQCRGHHVEMDGVHISSLACKDPLKFYPDRKVSMNLVQLGLSNHGQGRTVARMDNLLLLLGMMFTPNYVENRTAIVSQEFAQREEHKKVIAEWYRKSKEENKKALQYPTSPFYSYSSSSSSSESSTEASWEWPKTTSGHGLGFGTRGDDPNFSYPDAPLGAKFLCKSADRSRLFTVDFYGRPSLSQPDVHLICSSRLSNLELWAPIDHLRDPNIFTRVYEDDV